MKSKNLILSAMLMALPSTLMAQQNIQKAFDALLKDKIVETKTEHILEHDPETGLKSAQADVYDFVITNTSALKHIKNIQQAFEQDKSAAYSLRTVNRTNNESQRGFFEQMGSKMGLNQVALRVGDGISQSVAIGSMPNSKYIYACFLDKERTDKDYRYAYAMEWAENDGKTEFRLAITYGTKNEQRKSKIKHISVNSKDFDLNSLDSIFSNVGNLAEMIKDNIGYNFDASLDYDSIMPAGAKASHIWLSEFNSYKKFFLKNPDGNTATHHATSIYNLCKNADGLEPDEKKLAAKEIAKLKKATKDDFIQNLFDMCIERLGK